jgi:hypothetical protein
MDRGKDWRLDMASSWFLGKDGRTGRQAPKKKGGESEEEMGVETNQEPLNQAIVRNPP